jgi:hypothetical protein
VDRVNGAGARTHVTSLNVGRLLHNKICSGMNATNIIIYLQIIT